jgi:hypothetical protein
MSVLAAKEDELKKAKRALALAEAEVAANQADRIGGMHGQTTARVRFFDLRDEVLKEQIEELKKKVADLTGHVEWERGLPR